MYYICESHQNITRVQILKEHHQWDIYQDTLK